MNDTNITLRFSTEELLTLASLAHVRGLPGLGENLFEGLTEAQLRGIFSAGTHSLSARGWVQPASESEKAAPLAVDEVVWALFGVCALSRRALYVSHLPTNAAPHNWYLHLGENLAVLHRMVMPGVHELFASVNIDEMLAEIDTLLGLNDGQAALPLPEARLAQPDFRASLELAQQSQPDAVMARLAAAGVPAETACILEQSFKNVEANSLVALMELPGNGQTAQPYQAGSFSLLRSPGVLWRLQTAADAADTICLKTVSAQQVREGIRELLRR